MTRHLGNLLDGHHAERAIAQRERLEAERERREAAEARVTIVGTRPGCEPDSMWVTWADGSWSYCGNWSKRPAGWPEGGA